MREGSHVTQSRTRKLDEQEMVKGTAESSKKSDCFIYIEEPIKQSLFQISKS